MAITFAGHREWQLNQWRGYQWFQSGVQPRNVAANPQIRNVIITTREQPYHPDPFVRIGVPPYFVVPPAAPHQRLFITQEQPRHPLPYTWSGPYKNVAPPPQITTSIILRQEQPGHPLPSVRAGVQGPDVAERTGAWFVITPQWHPYHPKIRITWERHVEVIDVNNGDKLILRQEQPFQPLWPRPPMVTGQATETEFAYGLIIGIG